MIREILISRIVRMWLDSLAYANHLHESTDANTRHNEIVDALSRLNDVMILSIYDRVSVCDSFLVVGASLDGNYADIKVGPYYGGMIADGTTHT